MTSFLFANRVECKQCGGRRHPEGKHMKRWLVTSEAAGIDEDDGNEVYAYSADDAAREFAEDYDRDEHPLLRGVVLDVDVRDADFPESEPERFTVSGEAVPQYYVRERR